MARIRSIKPEIRRSLTVSSWPYPVRWTFVGLPGYVDDAGRGLDDTRLIKAELYPLDDDMTSRKLDGHLQRIAETGPLCRYEIDGQKYLHLTSFDEHQRVNRPTPSRIPPCPIHEQDVSAHAPLTEPSSPRAQARVPAEQGAGKGAGSREGSSSAAAPSTQPPSGPHDSTTTSDHDDPIRTLLDEHQTAIGNALSPGTRHALAQHVATCLARSTPDQTRDALSRLRAHATTGKPALPGLLPHLLDDVLLEGSSPDDDDPTADPEIAAWLAEQRAQEAAR